VRRRFVGLFFLVAVATCLPLVDISTPSAVIASDQSSIDKNRGEKTEVHPTSLTKTARRAFIQKAQVWSPTDIPRMNLRVGPTGPGAFQPNEEVTCDYVDIAMHGKSSKFHCVLRDGEVVKVRYGAHNGEVEGSVLATRLLWALGFAADRVYPVRVRCRGCSSDPWKNRGGGNEEHDFDPAVIEHQPDGHEMTVGNRKAGWAWSELDLVDENQGGAPAAHRDALKLLAVFMQHTDTEAPQQRLLCSTGAFTRNGECEKPFLLLHDVGKTFGHANTFNRNSVGSVNFDEWAKTPIWRDSVRCIGHLSRSHTGTLGDPRITEPGRKFLADLLVQLSERQVHDLFEVAGVDRRSVSSSHGGSQPGVEGWVAVFNQKRNEIITTHCAD